MNNTKEKSHPLDECWTCFSAGRCGAAKRPPDALLRSRLLDPPKKTKEKPNDLDAKFLSEIFCLRKM